MKTFHTGIDTQLTSKVNDNAELLDRSIKLLSVINTGLNAEQLEIEGAM